MSESKPKTVTVSVVLPEPPDGWEWDQKFLRPSKGVPYLCPSSNRVEIAENDLFYHLICCHRVHKFPPNASGTFYWTGTEWYFTDLEVTKRGDDDAWSANSFLYVPATVFSDFTVPPERRPYRVANGIEVKDGAK